MLTTKHEGITSIRALLSYIVNTKVLIRETMMDLLTSDLFADRDQSSHSKDQMTKPGLLHYNKDLLERTTTRFWQVSHNIHTK
jgi:hypothetical protein